MTLSPGGNVEKLYYPLLSSFLSIELFTDLGMRLKGDVPDATRCFRKNQNEREDQLLTEASMGSSSRVLSSADCFWNRRIIFCAFAWSPC